MFKIHYLYYTALALILFSCKAKQNNLNYMKDDGEEIATAASVANSSQNIQPGDQLGIWITAEEMEAVAPFNQNMTRLENVTNTAPSGNTQPTAATGQIPTYIVKTDNSITFPVIGKLSTEGKTLEQFEEELTQKMKRYVYNPVVHLKTLNYKVTVLGEVSKPGTYTIPDGQATVLSALGLAGDLTKYGVRNDILLVRNENGTVTKQRLDITRSDFISSPFYYMKQNDVLYVNSNETVAKQSRLDPNAGIYISVASIVVTILALVFKK
ncbi:polysaccharide biosynthesis/export family protein [uncultured Chryseobacterium sp.]|uniref:polysaccharide biosynthesis/export family protein n=1 Tax=uncultured Chryseobacterium sp. TaxID=259322 RepID=UPI0026098668|nr:polysaccharide biosynthesis/export family protein [uncultured Chryseobacterium sp.]